MPVALPHVQVILFDLDDVLLRVRDEAGNYIWRQNIEQDLGVKNEDMTEFFISPIWKQIIRGELNTQMELQKFLDGKSYALNAQAVIEYFYKNNSIPDEKMFTAAKALAEKFPSYIATNQNKGRIEYLWRKFLQTLGFNDYFSSCDIGREKPHRQFFDCIVKKLGVPKEQILLIDDKAKNVAAAEEYGMMAYHFQGSEKFDQELLKPLLALRKSEALLAGAVQLS